LHKNLDCKIIHWEIFDWEIGKSLLILIALKISQIVSPDAISQFPNPKFQNIFLKLL